MSHTKDTNNRVIAANVRKIRELRNLTQEEMAEKSGVSLRAISDLEREIKLPRFDTIEKIAIALNMPVSAFWDSSEPTLNENPYAEIEMAAREAQERTRQTAQSAIDVNRKLDEVLENQKKQAEAIASLGGIAGLTPREIALVKAMRRFNVESTGKDLGERLRSIYRVQSDGSPEESIAKVFRLLQEYPTIKWNQQADLAFFLASAPSGYEKVLQSLRHLFGAPSPQAETGKSDLESAKDSQLGRSSPPAGGHRESGNRRRRHK